MTTARDSPTDSSTEPPAGPTFVVGGGPLGRDVARRLSASGHAVTLVDTAPQTDPPPNLDVRRVDDLDAYSLRAAGIGNAAVVYVLEPDDARTLMLAQHARMAGADRVVASLSDADCRSAFDALGVETVDAAAAVGRELTERL